MFLPNTGDAYHMCMLTKARMYSILVPIVYLISVGTASSSHHWRSWELVFRFVFGLGTLFAHRVRCRVSVTTSSTSVAYILPVVHTVAIEVFNAWYNTTLEGWVPAHHDYDIRTHESLRTFLLTTIAAVLTGGGVAYCAACKSTYKRATLMTCATMHIVSLYVYIKMGPKDSMFPTMFLELVTSLVTAPMEYTDREGFITTLLGLHCWFPYRHPILAMLYNNGLPSRAIPRMVFTKRDDAAVTKTVAGKMVFRQYENLENTAMYVFEVPEGFVAPKDDHRHKLLEKTLRVKGIRLVYFDAILADYY